MIIYRCLFPNGKMYIGQTSRNFENRLKEHRLTYKNKNNIRYNSVLYKAIRKYGWENLKWDIIDNAKSIEELNDKEKYWIEYYHTYIHLKDSKGYNVSLGGNSNLGYKTSKLTKEKLSKTEQGENNTRAKLCKEDVLKIVELSKIGVKQKDIALLYNVGEPIISKILSGVRWNSVTHILI